MAVGHVDLTIYKSTDFSMDFDFTDSDGNAMDLSNSTIAAKLRTKPSATSATDFTTSVDPDSNGDTDKIRLQLTDTVTGGLSTGRYYWDILETNGTDTQKLMSGRATVIEAVSR